MIDNCKSECCGRLLFSSVTLADKPVVDRYMQRYGKNSCQHSFVNLFTLSEKYGSKICVKDDFLYTLREGLCTEGKRVYLAPMGGGDLKAAYAALLADAAAYGCKAVFQTVTGEQVDFLRKNFPGRFQYTELRDYAEYVYSSDRLIRMEGGIFADKRNKINKLLRMYGERLEIRELSQDNTEDVWKFEQNWIIKNVSTHDEKALKQEARSIRIQLDHYDALDLRGIGVYIDQQMVGFCYGVPLNAVCFDGLIQKATRDVDHLFKLLSWKISSMCAAPFPYFNWEEDVGVSGLRNCKMTYRPVALIRKFLVEEQETGAAPEETENIPIYSSIELYPGEELIPNRIPG